jgi:hypothetical protein
LNTSNTADTMKNPRTSQPWGMRKFDKARRENLSAVLLYDLTY